MRGPEHPVRLAVGVTAPLLALAALATHLVWELYPEADSAGGVSLVATAAAFIASGWAIVVAPSRFLLAAAVAAFVTASITAVLWWLAATEVLKTT